MLTHGTYMSWRFGSGWDEVGEEYENGKYEDEWIAENMDWLSQVSGDPEIHSRYSVRYRKRTSGRIHAEGASSVHPQAFVQ